jgi:glutaredoxin 2
MAMSTLFFVPLTKAQKRYDGEKTASSNVNGKIVICLQKTETRSMPITLN